MPEREPIRTTQHAINHGDIDDDASKVLRRLQQFGYHAYLVGGGVRDLLLDRRPKDFDVVTSARPNEVRKLFRNCRLIGRRFRLAHILFGGGKVIEVATFRAVPAECGCEGGELITDDNEFGTAGSDARRRDFTVNALFYDPHADEIIDYVGGLVDLDERVLRTIGEPCVRFREDPVRMLRAVKFAGRLGFNLLDAERAAIRSERFELRKAAVPRLLEELIRMLWGGAAGRSYDLLEELGLLELLLPEVSAYLSQRDGATDPNFRRLLAALDLKCGGRAGVENGVLLASVFWAPYRALLDDLPLRLQPRHLRALAETLLGPAAVRLRIPRRDVGTAITVLESQVRHAHLPRHRAQRAALARSPSFPAAMDFLELRAEAGLVSAETLAAWCDLAAEHDPPERNRDARVRSRRGGRRRR